VSEGTHLREASFLLSRIRAPKDTCQDTHPVSPPPSEPTERLDPGEMIEVNHYPKTQELIESPCNAVDQGQSNQTALDGDLIFDSSQKVAPIPLFQGPSLFDDV